MKLKKLVAFLLICTLLMSANIGAFAAIPKEEKRISKLDHCCPELFDAPWYYDDDDFISYLVVDCYEQIEEQDTELEIIEYETVEYDSFYLIDCLPDILGLDASYAEVGFYDEEVFDLRIYYHDDVETVIATYENAYGVTFKDKNSTGSYSSPNMTSKNNECYVTVREGFYGLTVVSYYL